MEAQRGKVEAMNAYPSLYRFLLRAYYETDPAVSDVLGRIKAEIIGRSGQNILEQTDVSRFREGVDPRLVLNMILWSADGFMRERCELGLQDLDRASEEFMAGLRMLKKHLYTEEKACGGSL